MSNIIGFDGLANTALTEFIEKCDSSEDAIDQKEVTKSIVAICENFITEIENIFGWDIISIRIGFTTPDYDYAKLKNGEEIISEDWFEEFLIWIKIEDSLPDSNIMDANCLKMSDYGFTLIYNSADEGYSVINQQYDFGEWDTGYFISNGNSESINRDDYLRNYKKVEELMK